MTTAANPSPADRTRARGAAGFTFMEIVIVMALAAMLLGIGIGFLTNAGRATVAHVNHCLRELHKLAVSEKWTSLALPRLATGVGGLDWKDVRPLFDQHLGSLNAKVIVYSTYRKGVAAAEGL